MSDLNVNFLFWGFLFNLIATTITIVRWRYLTTALGVPLSHFDALKYGFIGFVFNLSPVGIVGGDAVKVILLNKKNGAPAERATASVVIDRVLGLYAMFVLGLIVIFATRFNERPEPTAQVASRGLVWLTIALTIFLAFIIAPEGRRNLRRKVARRIPFVGGFVEKLTEATLLYRERKLVLLGAFFATFAVHILFATSLYCFARGMYGLAPDWGRHLILYCVGNIGSTIPLSAGPFEYFLDELYPLFPILGREAFEKGHGMAIGVAYRLGTVAVAALGSTFYFISRSDAREALKASRQVNSAEDRR
ncbi:MAG: flippase-like domain-containing protein [Thermoguttaceae bacterium]|nr:flippase-like domain-containing protein [Thermoguttaceae bacterium]